MSERRDCVCPRARHEHGTRNAYANDRCRCQPCRTAWADYTRQRRRDDAQMMWRGRTRWVSNVGTARRLQALGVVGWGLPAIATRMGIATDTVLGDWRRGNYTRLRPDTAAAVAAVYDALWDKEPPTSGYPVKVRRHAAAQGWAPPLAWDDDEIDDPAATAHVVGAGSWDLAPCGTVAAARRHYRRGEPLDEACRNADRRNSAETRARRVA